MTSNHTPIYSKEMMTYIYLKLYTQIFTAGLFIIAPYMLQTDKKIVYWLSWSVEGCSVCMHGKALLPLHCLGQPWMCIHSHFVSSTPSPGPALGCKTVPSLLHWGQPCTCMPQCFASSMLFPAWRAPAYTHSTLPYLLDQPPGGGALLLLLDLVWLGICYNSPPGQPENLDRAPAWYPTA